LGLAAYKAGKTVDARTLLTPLFIDQSTPQSISERAQIVMAEIAAGEIAEKADATAPAAAPAKTDTPPVPTMPPAKKD
jgi:hypothetical protein